MVCCLIRSFGVSRHRIGDRMAKMSDVPLAADATLRAALGRLTLNKPSYLSYSAR